MYCVCLCHLDLRVKVRVTGLLNFRQLAKPCMLAAMTAAPLRGFLIILHYVIFKKNFCLCAILKSWSSVLCIGQAPPGDNWALSAPKPDKIFVHSLSPHLLYHPSLTTVWIFPHATMHHSQWPWCWDFPVCCRPAFRFQLQKQSSVTLNFPNE